jgi:hypothetical protein
LWPRYLIAPLVCFIIFLCIDLVIFDHRAHPHRFVAVFQGIRMREGSHIFTSLNDFGVEIIAI